MPFRKDPGALKPTLPWSFSKSQLLAEDPSSKKEKLRINIVILQVSDGDREQ